MSASGLPAASGSDACSDRLLLFDRSRPTSAEVAVPAGARLPQTSLVASKAVAIALPIWLLLLAGLLSTGSNLVCLAECAALQPSRSQSSSWQGSEDGLLLLVRPAGGLSPSSSGSGVAAGASGPAQLRRGLFS